MHTKLENINNIIPLAKVVKEYGVKGEFLLKTYNQDDSELLYANLWYILDKNNQSFSILDIKNCKKYRNGLLALSEQFNAPEQIKSIVGKEIGLLREQFRKLEDSKDEFYFIDLIGKQVINVNNENLGIVHDVLDNPAHCILCIHPYENCKTNDEILIPFINSYIKNVENDKIIVDDELL